DFGVLHAAAAGCWLFVATAIGLALLILPMKPWTLHAAAAYGVAGLVGFIAQMVAAIEARLLPMATWYWMYADSDYRVLPPSLHSMRDRVLQGIVFAGWTLGVPALAAGMFLESAALVRAGATSLLIAVALAIVDNAFVVFSPVSPHAHQNRSTSGSHVQRT